MLKGQTKMLSTSERRIGRSEEQRTIFNSMLKRASHDLDLLMGMLISDDSKTTEVTTNNNIRQRKQGTFVRHPLDLVDTNTQQQQQQKQQQNQQKQQRPEQPSEENKHTNDRNEKENDQNKIMELFPPLRRAGSISSSIISRKSSSRSIGSNRSRNTNRSGTTNRSNVTITSNSSYVKKNSGNFDGGNTKTKNRRKNSVQRKSSSCSQQRDRMIADFYRELEELEEISSSDSSDDEKPKTKKIPVEEIKSRQRVEEYLMNLPTSGEPRSDEDEGIMSDTTKSDLTPSEPDERYGSRHPSSSYTDPMGSMNSSPIPKERKYIPRPKLNMITKHENLNFDHNKNNVDTSDHSHKKHRARSLPTKPRGITIVDRDLQERFRDKENMREEVRTNEDLRNSFRKRDLDLRDSFRKKEHLKESFYRNSDGRGSYRKATQHNWTPVKAHHHRIPTKAELLFDADSETSCSTDSAHGSTRSLSTASSISVAHNRNFRSSPAASVPKNFIPGQAKRREQRKRNISVQEKVRTASFCFKGITCSVQSNAPRTYRALAHAGCIGLVIPGPPNHKCTQ